MTDTDTQIKLSRFITDNMITAVVIYGNNAPTDMKDDWRLTANPWTVGLRHGRRRMTIPYWTGSAVTREPDVDSVLECLAIDASGIENARSFEDWCADHGYDDDSRTAEVIFKACERNAKRLRQFLGEDLYKELLWDVER